MGVIWLISMKMICRQVNLLRLLFQEMKLKKQLNLRTKAGGLVAGALFLMSMLSSGSAMAGGGATGGATEPTQILNHIELVLQYAKQLEQYATQLKQYQLYLQDLKQIEINNSDSVMNVIDRAGTVMDAVNSIGGRLESIDRNLQTKYDNEMAGSFADKYHTWSSTSRATLSNAMRVAGMNRDAYSSDRSSLDAMFANLQAANGTVSAVQAMGAILAENVSQTQKLQDLVASQNIATSSYMIGKNAKDDAVQKKFEGVNGVWTPSPGPSTQSTFQSIKVLK